MRLKKFISLIAIALVCVIGLSACGGGSSSSSSASSSGSSLKEYAGKWVLFQRGNRMGESATFTLDLKSNGNVSVRHSATPGMGQSDVILDEGKGKAELNGTVLYVELTSGKSRGTTYRFIAKGGQIYDADGTRLTRQ